MQICVTKSSEGIVRGSIVFFIFAEYCLNKPISCEMSHQLLKNVPYVSGHRPQSGSPAIVKRSSLNDPQIKQILPRQAEILQNLGFSTTNIEGVFKTLTDPSVVEIDELVDMLYDMEAAEKETLKSFPRIPDGSHQENETTQEELKDTKLKGLSEVRPRTSASVSDGTQEYQSKDAIKKLDLQDELSGKLIGQSLFNQENIEDLNMDTEMENVNSVKTKEESLKTMNKEQQHSVERKNMDKQNMRTDVAEGSEICGKLMTDPPNSHPLEQKLEMKNPRRAKEHEFTKEERQKIKKLKEERKKLLSNKICHVCSVNDINVLFLPCRHMVTCEVCGETIENCIKCDQQIIATVKIYML